MNAETGHALVKLSVLTPHFFTKLTSLGYHAADPWTQVVHFPHAASQLTRVVCAIGLPLATARTPLGTAVGLAHKHILAIKGLEAGTVGVGVWRRPAFRVSGCSRAAASVSSPAVMFLGVLLLRRNVIELVAAEGHEARVGLDGDEGAEVGCNHEEEEDKVEDDEGGAEAVVVLLLNIVLDCGKRNVRGRPFCFQEMHVKALPEMCPTMP